MPRVPCDPSGAAALPTEPGVYLFLDAAQKPLYVGKAESLRARVRAYLNGTDRRPFVPRILARAAHLDYVVTGSAKDALLLENNLIKRYAPRYNIRLRDDKTYFSLRLDLKQEWPRLEIVRRRREDGSLYFGPYTSAAAARKTIQFLNALFPIRTCHDATLYNRTRPCLDYEIGRCVAPCVGYVSQEDYRALLDRVVRFLSGRDPDVVDVLEREMAAAADRLDFEKAAELRDRIDDVRKTLERAAAARGGGVERHALAAVDAGRDAVVAVIEARGHVLTGGETFRVKNLGPPGEILSAFLGQYYAPGRPVPEEILLEEPCDDMELHVEALRERRPGGVALRVPERGEGVRMTELARRNAESAARTGVEEAERTHAVLEKLRDALGLVRTPERIECYDVSHLMGAEVVASGVAFSDGVPDKARYRRYKLRDVQRNDDFAALEEVLRRRLRRGRLDGDLPDLVVIDGGRPQLRRVLEVVRELKAGTLDVIGLAKARTGPRAAAEVGGFERIVLPDRDEPVILPQDAPELLLLARIRDEAHRFAITYGRKLRRKAAVGSVLERIEGIAGKLSKALLVAFGDLEGVKRASAAELAAVPGMTRIKAEALKRFFDEHALAGVGDRAAGAESSDDGERADPAPDGEGPTVFEA